MISFSSTIAQKRLTKAPTANSFCTHARIPFLAALQERGEEEEEKKCQKGKIDNNKENSIANSQRRDEQGNGVPFPNPSSSSPSLNEETDGRTDDRNEQPCFTIMIIRARHRESFASPLRVFFVGGQKEKGGGGQVKNLTLVSCFSFSFLLFTVK